MISNQTLQKTIYDMKGITGAQMSLWDMEGTCIVSTDEVTQEEQAVIENYLYMDAEMELGSDEDNQCHIYNISDDGDACYMLLIQGKLVDSDVVGGLCVCQLENLMKAYQERLTKRSFMEQLLLGNLVEAEINNKARNLNIEIETKRVVYVIEPKKKHDGMLVDILKSFCRTEIYDYIITTESGDIVVIKQLQSTDTEEVIYKMAKMIVDTLSAEAMMHIRIGYGTVVNEVKGLVKSYKEALMALEVGNEFYQTKRVLSYTQLGIGRLIYQLPVAICSTFLDEVLQGQAITSFDEETMKIVHHFFENNLNISETSRQLYIHRNTLGYRLEKIQKATGLDIRVFEDAMTFKVAMMVSDHMLLQKLD